MNGEKVRLSELVAQLVPILSFLTNRVQNFSIVVLIQWCYFLALILGWASQVTLVLKNVPAKCRRLKQVPPLGQKDPLEEGNANHSSVLV